jgi:Leucine-rich repeat (LRR) protein
MSGLQHLRVLSLRGNQLPALPPGLGSCSQLEELDVRDNQLAALPAELGRLSSLKALFADNNRWGGPFAPAEPAAADVILRRG